MIGVRITLIKDLQEMTRNKQFQKWFFTGKKNVHTKKYIKCE